MKLPIKSLLSLRMGRWGKNAFIKWGVPQTATKWWSRLQIFVYKRTANNRGLTSSPSCMPAGRLAENVDFLSGSRLPRAQGLYTNNYTKVLTCMARDSHLQCKPSTAIALCTYKEETCTVRGPRLHSCCLRPSSMKTTSLVCDYMNGLSARDIYACCTMLEWTVHEQKLAKWWVEEFIKMSHEAAATEDDRDRGINN